MKKKIIVRIAVCSATILTLFALQGTTMKNSGEIDVENMIVESYIDAETLFDFSDHKAYVFGSDGKIRPNDSITRAEVCSIFYSLLSNSAKAEWGSVENTYTDVAEKDWYNTAVSTLQNIGLLDFIDGESFCPGKTLTRAEFAVILSEFYETDEENEPAKSAFSDIWGHWAEENIEAAAAQGLLSGYYDGTFMPDAEISRAEIIAAMNRFLGRSELKLSSFQRGMTLFSDNTDTSKWYFCDIVEASTDHEYTVDETGTEIWNALTTDGQVPNVNPYISICHAGGIIDGNPGTNSAEAMNRSYLLNCQYIEVDLTWTADGYLVCLHDWYKQYSSSIENYVAMNLEEFKQIKILDKYTPMTLYNLAEWIRAHPSVRVITDVKSENIKALTTIAAQYPDIVDRLIPQIFQYSEYETVKELGYENIILSLYQMTYNEKANAKEVANFAKSHSLWGITFSYELVDELGTEYVATLESAGTQLFVHTVNDPDEIEHYINMEIDGVYRDY
ncbi:MAG: S-layer homology domain-containing protein [Oscillospiraceae bacterium]|nr:S-layer homology domain-containing protein [Oscillospiraceae bacterium]